MQNVNGPDDSVGAPQPFHPAPPDDSAIVSWVRWWHWAIVVAVCLAAFLYFPLWRFERNWQQLRVGDPFDRMKELLGDPGKPSFTVQGVGASGADETFIYTKYWKTYEVTVSKSSRRVTAKTVTGGASSPTPPTTNPSNR